MGRAAPRNGRVSSRVSRSAGQGGAGGPDLPVEALEEVRQVGRERRAPRSSVGRSSRATGRRSRTSGRVSRGEGLEPLERGLRLREEGGEDRERLGQGDPLLGGLPEDAVRAADQVGQLVLVLAEGGVDLAGVADQAAHRGLLLVEDREQVAAALGELGQVARARCSGPRRARRWPAPAPAARAGTRAACAGRRSGAPRRAPRSRRPPSRAGARRPPPAGRRGCPA